jgi:CDP-paratose 2-epimerase
MSGIGIPVIVGGAGFIGTNVARRFLDAGESVLIYDSLARRGGERNLEWLKETYGERVRVQIGDVRDSLAVRRALADARLVFHFAAQVAVTTSLVDPVHDFDVNLRGTLTLLEELRRSGRPIPLLYTSTNKVYGDLAALPLRELPTRYEPADPWTAASGIDERWPLELASPYGCSKGGAEQYVLEYTRSFGLKAVVARMSCIYGPHQLGTEDQGWVAHFLRCAVHGRPITVYGDGKQVRDILYVEDLVEAFVLLLERIDEISGQAFNLGGGPGNALSLLELIELMGAIRGAPIPVSHDLWRTSDQRYYVSNTRKVEKATGWQPRVSAADGVARLYDWLEDQAPRSAVRAPAAAEEVAR